MLFTDESHNVKYCSEKKRDRIKKSHRPCSLHPWRGKGCGGCEIHSGRLLALMMLSFTPLTVGRAFCPHLHPYAWLSHVTWFDQWVVSTCDGWRSRGWKSAYALGLLSCNNRKNTPELLGGALRLKHGPILPHPSWGHDDNHESPAESSQPSHSWPDAWAGPTEIGRKTQMTHRPRSNNAYVNKYLHNY